MISVFEAKDIIAQNTLRLPPLPMALAAAAGHCLAIDVVAPYDIPAFPQSSMDGYAFTYHEAATPDGLEVSGISAAGNDEQLVVAAGQAVRIFTGAPVPAGADTVVMQEKTELVAGRLHFNRTELQPGSNVRLAGAETRAGSIALPAGSTLSPAAIGFLAGIGLDEVQVHRLPRVAVIVTGKELASPGKPLSYGQVYESNSLALQAALLQAGIHDVAIHTVDDDLAATTATLRECLHENDLVLLTGGVSVGDYDFVVQATAACGVTQLFHKIRQRPGKPLFFGRRGEKLVFGLPGNPSSVLTCFYQYVCPAIAALTGSRNKVTCFKAPAAAAITKNTQLTHFLKAFFDGTTVAVLDAQESFRMHSFARANCLVELPEQCNLVNAGEPVIIHLLP